MLRKFSLSPWFSLAPALILILVMLGASLLYAIAQSLGIVGLIGQNEISLKAYQDTLNLQSEFWVSLGFTLWISAASTILACSLALIGAIWLAKGRKGIEVLALNWNLAFPHLVWATALLLFLSQSGLLARWAASMGMIKVPAEFPILVQDRFGVGIILDYIGKEIPFLVLILLASLRSQSVGYDVVAENLGANRWQRLRYITVPQVMPAVKAGALLVFGFIFSSYEVPALLGVDYPRTLSMLALRFFLDPNLHARSEGMVISLIVTLIVLAAAIIGLKLGNKEE
jgi:putative spermidine/putrescine transport system permease protein